MGSSRRLSPVGFTITKKDSNDPIMPSSTKEGEPSLSFSCHHDNLVSYQSIETRYSMHLIRHWSRHGILWNESMAGDNIYHMRTEWSQKRKLFICQLYVMNNFYSIYSYFAPQYYWSYDHLIVECGKIRESLIVDGVPKSRGLGSGRCILKDMRRGNKKRLT